MNDRKMWETWTDFRLDEAPNMYKGARKSAQKDIDSLDKNIKMMIIIKLFENFTNHQFFLMV